MTQDSTVLLYTYTDELQANSVRDKLKAAGIDSFIEKESLEDLDSGSGIKVKIFSKDLETAEKIING